MLGRRGPAQAAFTPPELKELGELGGADVFVDPAELELDPASEASLETAGARARRNVDILCEFAARAPAGKPKGLTLRFCVSPVQILGEGRVEAIEIVRNSLVMSDDGQIKAVPTQDVEVIPCGLVLRSVGYRGVALPGVPFDERRGVIANEQGRVSEPGSRSRSTSRAGSAGSRRPLRASTPSSASSTPRRRSASPPPPTGSRAASSTTSSRSTSSRPGRAPRRT